LRDGGAENSVFTFQNIETNIREAMSTSNGIFTAPVTGIYYFQANNNKDNDNPETWIYLHKNTTEVACGYCPTSLMTQFCAVSATLKLNSDEIIKVYREENNVNFANFTGYYLNSCHFLEHRKYTMK